MKLTSDAERQLKQLVTSLKASRNGVTSIENAIKGYRAAMFTASNYDSALTRSEEYKALDKHLSTYRLPKVTDWSTYVTKTLSMVEQILKSE